METEEYSRNSKLSQNDDYMINSRVLLDSVHGQIELDKYLWDFIDTEEFQRLRHLKQLGNVHMVFPGATHTRFEHSLGTAYLSNKLINNLQKDIADENKPSEMEVKSVVLAGLLHDLGHGPFSHLFDRQVIRQLQMNKGIHQNFWEHENGSAMLVEYMIENSEKESIRSMSEEQIKLIQNLILGDYTSYAKNRWIFQIVSNKSNSIDVDKFDYILRDTYHLGIEGTSVDYDRIFNSSKVINNELCFNDKSYLDIDNIFHSRYNLFKQIYLHKTSYAIDLMVKDCLLKADPVFNFLEVINNPSEYVKLDDSILYRIENDKKNSQCLRESKQLIKRINNRELYKCIKEILIPCEFKEQVSKELTASNIVSHQKGGYTSGLNNEDIEVVALSVDYGNGEKNPFDSINFYGKSRPNETIKCTYGGDANRVFKEFIFRIYLKDTSKEDIARDAVNNTFSKIHADYSKFNDKWRKDILDKFAIKDKANNLTGKKRKIEDLILSNALKSDSPENTYTRKNRCSPIKINLK